ncbi:hypothetical protein CROQUDRAFT_441842 [Cronartium quercuum f. sp. fusiforme G11]|uniref:Uncharacterized protein n=1 Tax=Cronartium quercuum f. sp. fusiforme G11 TaxID=708437 RepID=A0A9P6N5Z1_9BASI|nr:hypothetical protein CROQUDRAFT_441842 [Cronartium quercuum f. sp. fusiforme G11]
MFPSSSSASSEPGPFTIVISFVGFALLNLVLLQTLELGLHLTSILTSDSQTPIIQLSLPFSGL